MSPIRVLLADDHALVRAGLRMLVEEMAGAKVVAEAADGYEAVALARSVRPDVILMDIWMGTTNGLRATREIATEVAGVRIIIVSMHATEEMVSTALDAGARGYVVKESSPEELHLAIEASMRDEVYISPRVSGPLVSRLSRGGGGSPRAAQDGPRSPLDALSQRQRQILTLIAQGRATKQIAHDLDISVKTVESHRTAIKKRLGIGDVASLAIFAASHGLLATSPAPSRPDTPSA